jgi:flagellar biosynthesis/type III secretory pathway chaperone
MMPASSYDVLDTLLARMAQAAAELGAALERERDAMRSLDVSDLDTTTALKLRALRALHACEDERAQLCARGGVGPDRAGMRVLLATADASGALQGRWDALSAALLACHDDNRAAGVLLTASKRRVGDALALLRGDALGRELYGPDGRAHQGQPGAPLASA